MASLKAMPWRTNKGLVGLCGTFALLTFMLAFWHHHTAQAERSPVAAGVQALGPPFIPRKLWQIWFQQDEATERYFHHPELRETAGWLGMNPEHRYRLVGRAWSDTWVRRQFTGGADRDLVATYAALRNHGIKSDLLRYLLLYREGGVYTDIDTVALRPIDGWVPARHRRAARLVVGVGFDRRAGGLWSGIPHDLQFCQWAIVAAPGHPVFRAMADRALASLHELTVLHNTTMAELSPSSLETMTSTGPAAWTGVVFEHIQLVRPDITNLMNLSGIQEPQLYGDILVLNIDGFGMGQPHSGATNDGSIPETALLKHLFRGSWRNS